MKKISKQIIVLSASLLVLVGCSKPAVSHVTSGDELFADIKGTQITKEDIYQYSKLRFGTFLIQDNLIKMQIEDKVELTAEDNEKAKEQLEKAKEQMGENFESFIKASGYKDEEDYFEKFILTDLKKAKLFDKYLDENIEQIVTETDTHKIKRLHADSKAEAEAALEELKALEEVTADKFVDIATKYNTNKDEDFVIADSKIETVNESRTEDKHLNTHLKDAKPGLIEEVIMTDKGFEIILIETLDYEADKDLVVTAIKSNEQFHKIVENSMYATYAAEGNFEIHDKDLHEAWKTNNPFMNN